MNVHFIYPDIGIVSGSIVNQGIISISSVLKSAGHKVTLTYLVSEIKPEKVLKEVEMAKPDLLCISTTTCHYQYVEKYLAYIKKHLDIPVVVGGVHPTLVPEEVIANENVDIVCIGEGEYPLLELCNNLENGKAIDSIENLWIKKNGRISKNNLRPLIQNLDSLPFPDYDLFDFQNILKRTGGLCHILAGRGCPYKCTYCCNHALQKRFQGCGSYVRFHSVDYVLRQVQYLKEKYEFKRILFGDDLFTLNKRWTKEFCEKYKNAFDIPFMCQARVETIDDEIAELLAKAGCYQMNFGIEAGNEAYRIKLLKRNMSNLQIENAVRTVKKYGIKVSTYNIIGLPYETPELIRETILFNKRLDPDSIDIFVYNPYPGTELGEICKKEGMFTGGYLPGLVIRHRPQMVLKQKQLSRREFEKLYTEFDRFALEKRIKSDYNVLIFYLSIILMKVLGKYSRVYLVNAIRILRKISV